MCVRIEDRRTTRATRREVKMFFQGTHRGGHSFDQPKIRTLWIFVLDF